MPQTKLPNASGRRLPKTRRTPRSRWGNVPVAGTFQVANVIHSETRASGFPAFQEATR